MMLDIIDTKEILFEIRFQEKKILEFKQSYAF